MIGANFENNGTGFRVWAPQADAVTVAYTGHWSRASGFSLVRNGDYWEGFCPGMPAGTEYKYILVTGGQEIWRIDPAARDTSSSSLGGNAIVVDSGQEWPPFNTPPFTDLIIYQLHVGTFAGRNDDFSAQVGGGPCNIGCLEAKLSYIRELGFNAIQLLPVQEFFDNRSWGYNPSFYFSIESAYGSPAEVRRFVARAHEYNLAVLFDVVYNHVSNDDNPLWNWDIYRQPGDHGIYLYPPFHTDWGSGPAFGKQEVRDFYIDNAKMLLEEYQADGLRLDSTRTIEANRGGNNDGWHFLQELTWKLKQDHSNKYLVAEHLEDHESIIRDAGLHATWYAAAHHEFQRAAQGEDPVNKLKAILGKDLGYGHSYPNGWNLVKYLLGSHDDCGDDAQGKSIEQGEDWRRHRYFVEFYGGRGNSWARAKARLGWALTVAAMGTPMLFMGEECHHWGYWHDESDQNGDHRFDWSIAGDPTGMEMRRLVSAANWVRWTNPALRSETFQFVHEDHTNQVLAFKRWVPGGENCVLTVVNMGDRSFTDLSYGVTTGGQAGQWTQLLCTQDAAYGGREGAGNAFYQPWTQDDGRVYLNLPEWSVVLLRLGPA